MEFKRSVEKLMIAASLLLSACSQQQSTTLQHKDIVDAVFGSGHIENNSQYSVMANAEGYLKAAYVTEGDTVKKGQRLFSLTNDVQQTQVGNAGANLEFARKNTSPGSPQIAQIKIQISQAKDKNQLDSINYQRYSRLVKTHAVSAADYENAQLSYQSSLSNLHVLQKNLADLQHNVELSFKNARSQYRIQQQNNNYYQILSQAGGVIMNLTKKTGDYVKIGDPIALIGAGSLVIKIYIAEDDIQDVKPGQLALISLNSLKDKVFKARITKIYPSFNTTEQSFIADAQFTDEPGNLLNGTQLQANIIVREIKNALVVPSYYLINGDYLMVKGNKEKKAVKVGIRTLEWTEIKGGVGPEDILLAPNQK
jgi:multidrug efflux pump subunit AcrA (membrane-fusion protein)